MADNGAVYTVEYARSNRSACRGPQDACMRWEGGARLIDKGELRLGVAFVLPNGQPTSSWRHWACTTPKVLGNIGSVENLEGMHSLRPEDQERVRRAFELGYVEEQRERDYEIKSMKDAEKQRQADYKAASKAASMAEKEAGKARRAAAAAAKKKGGAAKKKAAYEGIEFVDGADEDEEELHDEFSDEDSSEEEEVEVPVVPQRRVGTRQKKPTAKVAAAAADSEDEEAAAPWAPITPEKKRAAAGKKRAPAAAKKGRAAKRSKRAADSDSEAAGSDEDWEDPRAKRARARRLAYNMW